MAKNPAKGPRAERKFVRTGEPVKVMQKLLDDLNEAKVGETGWNKLEATKVEVATFQLKLAIALLKCPPSPPGTVTQSYPGHGLKAARRRPK